MSRHAFIVLSGGQVSHEMSPIFGDIPSGLIPIRGKPALMHNIKTVLPATDSDVYIVVGHKNNLEEQEGASQGLAGSPSGWRPGSK